MVASPDRRSATVIDIIQEPLISLKDATKLIPRGRGGALCSFSCILRWGLRGARAADGSQVRLEMLRAGGRFCTSAAAIQRFFERLMPCFDSELLAAPRTANQRRRGS